MSNNNIVNDIDKQAQSKRYHECVLLRTCRCAINVCFGGLSECTALHYRLLVGEHESALRYVVHIPDGNSPLELHGGLDCSKGSPE